MTQDELVETLSVEFDILGELFLGSGAESTDDFNDERQEFICRNIRLVNKCIKSRGSYDGE